MGLDPPPRRQADAGFADHDVVDDANVQQGQRLLQPRRKRAIRRRRLGVSRGVVVRQHYRRCVVLQRRGVGSQGLGQLVGAVQQQCLG